MTPLELAAIAACGLAEPLAACAAGFAEITLLPGPGADRDALAGQIALADALSGGAAIRLLDTPDPDAVMAAFPAQAEAPKWETVRPLGTRRQVSRQAARALNADATQIPLPAGAPYGAVEVDPEACTLCLSCVSLCPSGALGDNPDKPQLRYQEDACLQCGICTTICPEKALTLVPQMDLTPAALEQRVLHEEEPFHCIECGTPFGSKSSIERITKKLSGHSMYAGEGMLKLLQMCDECRVTTQIMEEAGPMSGGARPRPRTTEDYLSARKDH